MSEILTPSSSFENATIEVPSTGDPLQSLNNKNAFQKVVNSLEALKDVDAALADGSGIEWPLTEYPTLSPRGMLHSQSLFAATTHVFNSWAKHGISSWRQTAESDPVLYIPINRFPHAGAVAGNVMTTARVFVNGGTGHGALPTNMPKLQLFRRTGQSAAFAQVGSDGVDASANVAAYENTHSISVTGLSIELHSSDEMFMALLGETGTNALMNQLSVIGAEIVAVVTKVAP